MSDTEQREHPVKDRLAHAYDLMMERVRHALDTAGEAGKTIEHALAEARDKAVELGEITREEAEQVGDYIRRDLHDMGDYLNETSKDFRTWFQMDLRLIEARILDLITSVADRTRVELAEIAARAEAASLWHTGEVTGPGVLSCTECGETLHFKESGRLPPCPKCHATTFKRSRN
jgi:rubrerythrin